MPTSILMNRSQGPPSATAGPADVISGLRCAIFFAVFFSAGIAAAQDIPLPNIIDEQIVKGYAARNLKPAELCNDYEFLRRISLDLAGSIPTVAQLKAFVADAAPDKRAKVIDQLLASPEHARHMQHLFDVMLLERQYANYVTEQEWRDYLFASFLANKPWDQLAREIVGTDGVDPATRPALRFVFVRTEDSYRRLNPSALTRDIGRLLLGVNLQCAQCHDHPSIDDYKQADYFGIFAFVSRSHVASLKQGDKTIMALGEASDGAVKFTSVFDTTKTEHVTTPHLPGAPGIAEPELEKGKEWVTAPVDGVPGVPAYSRRAQLAALLPTKENRPFARNMVNRLWDQMLGRGLVHPVEVHHSGNPASHPELLDLLTDRFIANGFDMRAMLRGIANSRTYQLSSLPPAGTSGPIPPEAFAIAAPRALRPEVYAAAMMQGAGFTDMMRARLADKLDEASLYKTVSAEMPNFVKAFAGPAGQAETGFQASLEQALFLKHSGSLAGWLEAKSDGLVTRLSQVAEPAAVAEELYLTALTRPPTAEETAEVVELWVKPEDRLAVIQDLLWALLSSSEFRFNH